MHCAYLLCTLKQWFMASSNSTKRLTININPKTLDRLNELAKKKDRSLSWLAGRAIDNYLATELKNFTTGDPGDASTGSDRSQIEIR